MTDSAAQGAAETWRERACDPFVEEMAVESLQAIGNDQYLYDWTDDCLDAGRL